MVEKATVKTYSRRLCLLSEVPDGVRAALSSGNVQTGSWTEWMATDMPALGRTVAKTLVKSSLKHALLDAASRAEGQPILVRLQIFGSAISAAVTDFDDPAFVGLQMHRSDVVRGWTAYAVNDNARSMELTDRLAQTLPLAADHHMTVRECAWMAFRPYFAQDLKRGLDQLKPISRSVDFRLRRFAIEVSRPRSVWGQHIEDLKKHPEKAIKLLENVRDDESKYVRLSVGNWLNDASKSRPEWVLALCSNWIRTSNKNTQAIVRRGLRTLQKRAEVPPAIAAKFHPGPRRRSVC